MDIRQDDPTAPYVGDLLAHHLEELRSVMGEHAQALDASGLSASSVTFWTAWQDGVLAGFVALKQLDETHGEVKSMRAAPTARRTGVGRAILDHIVAEARMRGLRVSAWRPALRRCTPPRSRSTAASASYLVRRSPIIRRARTTSS
ncbi:GNAT family N-acetyltransferase [Bradyrhizobium sp. CCBAU 65884]|uniref:GNAT family N-acetyltransferase n=1 Tax=Bradyrhizobium sp. CCBAU 65884 TaxID=722477 RepID=UPI0023058739|nr:GNAT family N-acetyltransferase [Bradyrhizobium sp. CCBAU 65884]